MENFRKYLLNEAKLETANPVFDNEDFWDDWTDFKRAIRRLRTRGVERQNIRGALATLSAEMDKITL